MNLFIYVYIHLHIYIYIYIYIRIFQISKWFKFYVVKEIQVIAMEIILMDWLVFF